MKQFIECRTQADVDRVTGDGNIAIVRSGRFVAWGSSHVEARGSSHVVAWGSSHVEATSCVSVHRQSSRAQIRGGVVIEAPRLETAQQWCEFYGVKISRGIATLYKAVRDDFRSAHGMSYRPGETPAAPDWDPVPECGSGLHFSFHPSAAKAFDYEATRFVACPVRVSELVVHPDGDTSKVKAPRVVGKGCVEVDRQGRPVRP
jgi:hypothetical protein